MPMRTLAAILFAVPLFAGETPVAGPPWKLDYPEARKEALAAGKPLFLYFTKTY